MNKIASIMMILLSYTLLSAGEQTGLEFNHNRYNLIHQSFQRMDTIRAQQAAPQGKSVLLATVYSAAIPGAGELYSKSYWKAVLFFGLELAGWTVYAVYQNKGADQDKIMKSYADRNWSEHKYWSKLYFEAEQLGNIPNLPDYELEDVENGYMLKDYNTAMVNSLRFLEEALGHTHKLPATKTQQYYEMIYKYLPQFGNGWGDADFFFTYNGINDTMTPMMFEYRGMRNEMNRMLGVASVSLNAILINHVLSALDAALTTRAFNRSISVSPRVHNIDYYGEKVQLYGLHLSW